MSHNVQPHGLIGAGPVLVIADYRDDVVRIAQSEDGSGIGIRVPTDEDDDLSGLVVRVEGEDLYALREFLNELPEEAFVRPADPVYRSDWSDGDILSGRKPHLDVLWLRKGGVWNLISGGGSVDVDDATMGRLVGDLYVVVRKQSAGIGV